MSPYMYTDPPRNGPVHQALDLLEINNNKNFLPCVSMILLHSIANLDTD
jgi:hypothetical protein